MNNTLNGNSARNYLYGGDGNDRLEGKDNNSGNDRLTGGTGADVFRFGSFATDGLDTITDFSRYAGDKISVSPAAFGGGLTTASSTTAQPVPSLLISMVSAGAALYSSPNSLMVQR